jgi:photosystem II oxygen-evolving enhancer protein 1
MRFRALILAFCAVCLGLLAVNQTALAVTPAGLTYDQVKNTGLANNCPSLVSDSTGSISVSSGQSITDLCMQPTSFFVKEEPKNARRQPEFVPANVMTRFTTTLESVSGSLSTGGSGLTFTEKDGIDFQPITVQIPNGERVPLLFTVKQLVASASGSSIAPGTEFEGSYSVPSYRTANFLDPKGRGIAAGYDNAVAIPAGADAEDLNRANAKRFDVSKGEIAINISAVDSQTGEFTGTFASEQFADSDLGAVDPLEVRIEGILYGRVE